MTLGPAAALQRGTTTDISIRPAHGRTHPRNLEYPTLTPTRTPHPLLVALTALIVLSFTFAPARAQVATPLAPVYRPGRYVPLRLDAPGPSTIRVRGAGIQGIDWPAPGRGGTVVPLFIYQTPPGGLTLTVDGQPLRLTLQPLGPDDPDPPDLIAFWRALDPRPPLGPSFDEDAYEAAEVWTPGRAPAVLRWTLVATGVIVLVLLVARYAAPKQATAWLVAASAGLCVGAAVLFPADAPRRVLPAEGQPGWTWVWQAAFTPRTADEDWTIGARFVPRSPAQLQAADPVLACDASGMPVQFRVNVGRGERIVFARP